MDKDILMFLSFVVILLILSLIIKNKKLKDGFTWLGAVLTSGVGGLFISSFFTGTLYEKGFEHLIAMFLMLVLGIYLVLRKPKNKKVKK